MRAVRAENGTVAVRQVPAPVGDGVRVHVRAAGICGSDLHLLEMKGGIRPDLTLGHEIAGVTDDGIPVAIEPLAPCDECAPCRRGDYHVCVRIELYGIGLQGGMADQIVVPERTIVPLPAGVDVADASLVEPLAVLMHSVRQADIRPDDRVAVIGGGTIGLCAVAAVRARGAHCGLVARHDAQREAGARLGAVDIDVATTGGNGDGEGDYDVVIEAAGTDSALADAVDLARPGGQVVIPGIYWGPVTIPGMAMCFKEVSLCPTALYGRHAGGRDVDAAAALLATDAELARSVITHRYPLDAAPEAFATAADRRAGAIKVVLEP